MFLVIDCRIQAHRLVLAASSDYFDAMFSGSLRESTENEIRLEEVQGDILESLVEYCYTGHIGLSPENVQEILMASHLMQLNAIVAGCSDYLGRHLKPSNCFEIQQLAERYDLVPLFDLANHFISDYFIEVRWLFLCFYGSTQRDLISDLRS